MNAVEVADLRKVFNPGRSSQVDALVDIDLVIHPGDFVTLIGPSGCGKSTLLRLIANLTEPTAGSVTVNGKSAKQARLDQDYGMAFQQAGLFDWRNVAKNIELPLELMAGIAPSAELDLQRCFNSSSCPSSVITCRGSCRAACNSASRLLARSQRTRRCC